MRRRPLATGVAVLAILAGAGGGALALALTRGAAVHEARTTGKLVAKAVPRVRRWHVGACHLRQRGQRLSCTLAVTVRAFSGGTITCSAQVLVVRVRRGRRRTLESRFPGRPRCAKDRRAGRRPKTGG